MKKAIAIGMILCTLLCGCEKKEEQLSSADNRETEKQTAATEGEASEADQTRLAYYEQLVNDLQEEVLNLKTEIYVNRVEYEALIEDLTSGVHSDGDSQQNSENNPPSDEAQPAPTSQFLYTVENGSVTVTAYIGKDKQVEIPATLEGYPVQAIGDRAFMDNASLTSVVIPDGVTTIGWFAFSGCVSLQSVSIPASVKSISYGAFQNCASTLTVSCASGSYAEQYARSYGMRTSS